MDIQLPYISGLDIAKMLKAHDDLKDIPVLAVTAFAMKGDKEKIYASGCDGYLSKPIAVPEFLNEVKRFLAMAPFRLIDPLITGHAEVDAEHQQLTDLLNELMNAVKRADDKACAGKINEISKAINSHFQNEVKIMGELGYDDVDAHKADHASVLNGYNMLIKDAERNGYGGSFSSEMTSILVYDMIRADQPFKAYLQEIGYQE
jgi:hemerythrin-like metal-binding protein